MRLVIPAILIVAAVGLFTLYTNPTYQSLKALQAQVASYDEALDRSKELRELRDGLLDRRANISAEDLQKLQRMLPDNVDNIRLIIEINNIAARHGLSLREVELGELSDSRVARNEFAIGASGDPLGSVDVSFSFDSSYEDFLIFLRDLEHSLRIVEVLSLDFMADPRATYSFSIKTYWLR